VQMLMMTRKKKHKTSIIEIRKGSCRAPFFSIVQIMLLLNQFLNSHLISLTDNKLIGSIC